MSDELGRTHCITCEVELAEGEDRRCGDCEQELDALRRVDEENRFRQLVGLPSVAETAVGEVGDLLRRWRADR